MAKLLTSFNKPSNLYSYYSKGNFQTYNRTPFENHYLEEIDQNIEKVKESFFRNPQFQVVYKNFNFEKPLWVWIGDGDFSYKQVGYQKMFSYPYEEYQFDIGDYITCIYNDTETTWIVTSISKNQKYNIVAHIEKTNNSLKWIDDYGKLLSHRCVIEDRYLEAYPRKIPSCCGRTEIFYWLLKEMKKLLKLH